jgi:hypothetical protein
MPTIPEPRRTIHAFTDIDRNQHYACGSVRVNRVDSEATPNWVHRPTCGSIRCGRTVTCRICESVLATHGEGLYL